MRKLIIVLNFLIPVISWRYNFRFLIGYSIFSYEYKYINESRINQHFINNILFKRFAHSIYFAFILYIKLAPLTLYSYLVLRLPNLITINSLLFLLHSIYRVHTISFNFINHDLITTSFKQCRILALIGWIIRYYFDFAVLQNLGNRDRLHLSLFLRWLELTS